MALRAWLKQLNFFDVDIEKELGALGVEGEDSFAVITRQQLKEYERKVTVARAADLKDQQAKVRLEKKLTGLRKIWEKLNGQDTKSKKSSNKAPANGNANVNGGHGGNVSQQVSNEALQQARGLKAWMQKEQIWEKDLFGVLVSKGFTGKDDNIAAEFQAKLGTRAEYDEVIREVRVLRAQELKDNQSRQRLEKLLSKFEKRWETMTNNKKTTIRKGMKAAQGDSKPSPREEKLDIMAGSGKELKKWMQGDGACWQKDLFDELLREGVSNDGDLASITEDQFAEIVRKVRVARAQELKDAQAKNRLEKVLAKLEKEWRARSGIKKTNIKKGSKAAQGNKASPTPTDEKLAEMEANEGKELKAYMQKEKFWQLDLYKELLLLGIYNENKLKNLQPKSFDEVIRKVRVARAQELKDAQAKNRLEKVLTKFEKEWEKQSGHKKTTIKAGMKVAKGGKKAAAPVIQKNQELATKGKALKKWLQDNNVWQKDLYDVLISKNIYGGDDLKSIDQKGCEDIIRQVRVERFTQLKDQAAKNRVDKLLTEFEKLWKAAN